MYTIRENIINNKVEGYWIDEKIHGTIVESIYVTLYAAQSRLSRVCHKSPKSYPGQKERGCRQRRHPVR